MRLKRARRKESYRRSLNNRRRRRKRELIDARGGACVDCGYASCAEALQFHHRDPGTKDFRLGEFNGSLARFLAEAEKCDLLCANCHRLRHAREATTSAHRTVALRRDTKLRAVAAFGGACGGCLGVFPAAAYDFHHLAPHEKEFALSTEGVYRPWAKVAAELAKCVMICANCHAEVHAGARPLDVAPGFRVDLSERTKAADVA